MELESKQSLLGQQRQEALMVIQQELKQSAKSHIDMSSRLEEQVAGELMIWIEKQRKRLDEVRVREEGRVIINRLISLMIATNSARGVL